MEWVIEREPVHRHLRCVRALLSPVARKEVGHRGPTPGRLHQPPSRPRPAHGLRRRHSTKVPETPTGHWRLTRGREMASHETGGVTGSGLLGRNSPAKPCPPLAHPPITSSAVLPPDSRFPTPAPLSWGGQKKWARRSGNFVYYIRPVPRPFPAAQPAPALPLNVLENRPSFASIRGSSEEAVSAPAAPRSGRLSCRSLTTEHTFPATPPAAPVPHLRSPDSRPLTSDSRLPPPDSCRPTPVSPPLLLAPCSLPPSTADD